MQKPKPLPTTAKRHLIKKFFENPLERKLFDKMLLITEKRGFDVDLLFWTNNEFHPMEIDELRVILEQKELELKKEEIERYLNQYQKYYRV